MASLMLTLTAGAQGVSKLFGLVGGNPQNNQSSNGFLFSTDSSGNNFQLQYNFPVTVFGALPANLELVPYNGKYYGTTTRGGVNNYGTLFEYDPATNIYTKKFDFGPSVSATGGTPKGSLLLYNNKFYGLAAEYATNGNGCLFEWDPATNVYTKKFDFTGTGGTRPGGGPQNSLKLYNGKMYGTTQYGGINNLGVVFEWNPATDVFTKLYDGTVATGREFYNNVTVYNNKLYGTSHLGGANNFGVLYSIDPALPIGSNYTIIKEFAYADGANANNNDMIVHNNKLYGCLNQGGNNFGGTLFELDPATNIFTKLFDFEYTISGRHPLGRLVAAGSKFIGLCSVGGTNGTGTIFEWDPASPTTVVKKYSFGINNFDGPVNPGSTFMLYNSKYYAVSYNGGFVDQGTLFEYDYTANTVIKKLNFNAAETGRIPYGKPTLLNGKLYGTTYTGPQEIFGSHYGCIWSFDPSTSIYSRRFAFSNANNGNNGRQPASSPLAYNGKLYGTTVNGGTSDLGVLYEFDPATDAYSKKDMQPITGAFPYGEPVVFNNKLYGLTNAGGNGNQGIIYSYDPASGVLSKLYDMNTLGSYTPNCGFVVYNNKLYATTTGGGANNLGTIFSFDPATNMAVNLASLSTPTGQSVYNAMAVYNGKMYNTAAAGGSGGRGTIFQFDPATNAISLVHNFVTNGTLGYDPKGALTVSGNKLYCLTSEGNDIVKVVELDPVTNTVTVKSSYTTTNLNVPVMHNGLMVAPAFIANGTPGSCENYPTVVINALNNNRWVPILNTAGDVVAEIKANGNNLGNVTASTYINAGTVREDAAHQLYLDRNISITVQNQPASMVDLRLYIKTSEYLALKNAMNSQGQPSGISSINDIVVLKNEQTCASALNANPWKLNTTAAPYEYGYVLTTSVNTFSTFFFAANTFAVLPLNLLAFDAVKRNNSVAVNWTTTAEINVDHFEVERSSTGTGFTKTGTVMATGGNRQTNYLFMDESPAGGINYYRLRTVDKNGQSSLSNIARVDFGPKNTISIAPNPARDYMIINGGAFTKIDVIDVSGKTVKQMNKNAINRYALTGLSKGIYFVRLTGGTKVETFKIVIE